MADNSAAKKLWTGQAKIVLDTLNQENRYVVKKEFIAQKYQETSWIFEIAYAYFIENAEKRLPRPQGAESPIWLYNDPQWVFKSNDSYMLDLEIPAAATIAFDLRKWSKILNLSYIGKDERDEAAFAQSLNRIGIQNTFSLFKNPFYPLQKQQVIKSWEQLFDDSDIPSTYIQCAAWELRREWVKTVYPPKP